MSASTHEITLNLPYTAEDCFAAAQDAVKGSSKFKLKDSNEALGTIRANVPPTFTSTTWGDNLTVTISPRDDGATMIVNSSSKVMMLLANSQQVKNVDAFVAAFTAEITKYKKITKTEKPSAPAESAADEILKFKQLMDAGVITEEEFAAKKAQLLGF